MDKNIKQNDVIEYFGVRYLVLYITESYYFGLSGYDFKVKKLERSKLRAGFSKVIDSNNRTGLEDFEYYPFMFA